MKKTDLEKLLIDESKSLIEVLQTIDRGGHKICFLTRSDGRLLATVSDGDVRRALIRGIALNANVKEFANYNPKHIGLATPKKDIRAKFLSGSVESLPLLDENGVIQDVVFIQDVIGARRESNIAIIMAGGLGSRLGELTRELPKPMLKIGDEPLLMHIIRNFKRHGYTDINISVNYKAEMIENYFQDGRPYGVRINYLREPKRLGTGGGIKLCENFNNRPFFVMNGDILTNANLKDMMDFHEKSGCDITVAVRPHMVQLAYGVIETADNAVVSLREKPELTFMINAGIYCINPDIVGKIPSDEYFEITELLKMPLKVGSYEIKDYWMDIGRIDDYFKANEDFKGELSGE